MQHTPGDSRLHGFSSLVMKQPHVIVTGCFLAAILLVGLVGERHLHTMTRDGLHSLQHELEVCALGVGALISAERRSLIFLRNYAELVLASPSLRRADLYDQVVQASLRDRENPAWEVPGAMGGPTVFGTNAQALAALEGFHRDTATLASDIVLARSISPLLAISQHPDTVQTTAAYISPNGVYVLTPEIQNAHAPDLVRRFSSMPYYRLQLPEYNPERNIVWTPIYTQLKKNEAIATLSTPVYVNDHFRGTVMMDVALSRLFHPQCASANLPKQREPTAIGLLSDNGDIFYLVDGRITAQRPAGFAPQLLDIARAAQAAWMKHGNGYVKHNGRYLLYQHVVESNWILLASTDDWELTLAAARHLFTNPLIVAWGTIAALLVGTLRIVTNIFGHYVASNSRLETLACSDPLTGLANRRRFQEVFDETLEQAVRARAKAPALVILMFDIDFFKHINDRFGHATGDRVLVIFADILRKNLRSMDLPARVGGEEFAALLPGADLEIGASIAERIRRAVEAQAAHASTWGDAAPLDGATFTVSIGVAACPGDCDAHYDTLMSVADRRLYSAKEGGRNRIVAEDSLSMDPAYSRQHV